MPVASNEANARYPLPVLAVATVGSSVEPKKTMEKAVGYAQGFCRIASSSEER